MDRLLQYKRNKTLDDVLLLNNNQRDVLIVFFFHLPCTAHTHTRTQMVFYIEACESGSMMKPLPVDIDGEYQKKITS